MEIRLNINETSTTIPWAVKFRNRSTAQVSG
nr:MAG TPA: hypothetical protein [Caudoviricetes sp.]